MENAFRFARRAAGVQDEKWMLAIQRLGRTVGSHALHFLVPPEIPAWLNMHLVTGTPQDNDLLHCLGQQLTLRVSERQGLIHVVLKRDNRPPPVSTVGRNYHFCL